MQRHLPHKEAALASDPDDRARAIGCANTLWLDAGGCFRATDVEATANLDAGAEWEVGRDEAVVRRRRPARAVIYGLIERESHHPCRQSLGDRAEELRRRFGDTVQPAQWSALPHLLARAGLLINTTSLGMAGQPALQVDLSPLRQDAVVVDLVYVPLETELLAAARGRGLATADGLGMLLYQAVRGFQQWFGVRPEVTPELRTVVEADLARTKE